MRKALHPGDKKLMRYLITTKGAKADCPFVDKRQKYVPKGRFLTSNFTSCAPDSYCRPLVDFKTLPSASIMETEAFALCERTNFIVAKICAGFGETEKDSGRKVFYLTEPPVDSPQIAKFL